MRQKDLVTDYFRGAECGVASNLEIALTGTGARVLKGYGHAVYAYTPADERFGTVCFTGWKGASKSTNNHINMIEDKADVCLDGRPSMSDVSHDPSLAMLSQISSNDKDYSKPHSRSDKRQESA